MIPGLGRFPWRRAWQPTPVFWPGESRGQRSLAGFRPRGLKESDTTEWLSAQRLSHQVKSVRARQIPYDITYIWNPKTMTQRELLTQQKQTHRDRKHYGHQTGKAGCEGQMRSLGWTDITTTYETDAEKGRRHRPGNRVRCL